MTSSHSLAEYAKALIANREGFDRANPTVRDAFQTLDSVMEELVRLARGQNNPAIGIHSIPMLWLLRRQAVIALDSLSSRQAYQAWVAIRPGLEAALIIGRWFDHPHLKQTWDNRWKDSEAYRKAYSGLKLRSDALPRSDDFQRSLSLINDHFLHPNPSYAFRHLSATKQADATIVFEFSYFDDPSFHWASVLALLHLLISLTDSLARMYVAGSSQFELRPDGFGLKAFEETHQGQVAEANKGPLEDLVLSHIGLWPQSEA